MFTWKQFSLCQGLLIIKYMCNIILPLDVTHSQKFSMTSLET